MQLLYISLPRSVVGVSGCGSVSASVSMSVLHKCRRRRRRQVCGTPQAKAAAPSPSHAAIIDEFRPPSPSRLGPDTGYK